MLSSFIAFYILLVFDAKITSFNFFSLLILWSHLGFVNLYIYIFFLTEENYITFFILINYALFIHIFDFLFLSFAHQYIQLLFKPVFLVDNFFHQLVLTVYLKSYDSHEMNNNSFFSQNFVFTFFDPKFTHLFREIHYFTKIYKRLL
jgi:hypothetical protein